MEKENKKKEWNFSAKDFEKLIPKQLEEDKELLKSLAKI